jgi:hypothetical protein
MIAGRLPAPQLHPVMGRCIRSGLDQLHVRLDHVAAQQQHERQRKVIGADEIQRDPLACLRQALHRAG